MEVYKFYNTENRGGIAQKDGDTVKIYLYNTYTINDIGGRWSDWVKQVEEGYLAGDMKNLSKNSLGYFLNPVAESFSPTIKEMKRIENPGVFYPRMYLGESPWVDEPEMQKDLRAYVNIQDRLNDILNSVEPDEANFSCFGHKTRDILILACTETEYLMRKVLKENGYRKDKNKDKDKDKDKDRYATPDYIKICEPLKLRDYKIKLKIAPDLTPLAPFSAWNRDNTTTSIEWYHAYNSVKHNRETMSNASFINMLNAVGAIHIMLESAYGPDVFYSFNNFTGEKSFFETVQRPNWSSTFLTCPTLTGNYPIKTQWSQKGMFFENP